eukprot:GHVR01180413.1.p1 GENE.GHVR01180413.1~~GHVR01180413.1.p1  ORF type:complete len:182 (-),score=32.77 GHVR01180413.1:602-1147(-)
MYNNNNNPRGNRGGFRPRVQRGAGQNNAWRRGIQVPQFNRDWVVGVAANQLLGIVPDVTPLPPAVTPQLSDGLLVATGIVSFRHAVSNAHLTIDYYLANGAEFTTLHANIILGCLGAVIYSIHNLPDNGVFIAHDAHYQPDIEGSEGYDTRYMRAVTSICLITLALVKGRESPQTVVEEKT